MDFTKSPIEPGTSKNDDDNQPPAKQRKLDNVDEVICSLYKELNEESGDKNEFNFKLAEVIRNRNQLKPRQRQWLNESSPDGLTFLMLASKYDNVEAVEFLIGFGLDVNKQDSNGSTASDYAWESNNLKCLIPLLNADAPFPKNFVLKSLESSKEKLEIIDIAEQAHNFHKTIRLGKLEDVKSFVKNTKIRYAYDDKNQCALTTALKSEKIKIYSFFRNNFYDAGVDSVTHKAELKKLPDRVKKQLRGQLKKHLNKPVVMSLLSKSKDISGCRENYEKILGFYEALYKIPEIRPILQLVAKFDKTEIVFDFNDESVFVMDSTADENALGITYHSEGYILIGAKRSDLEVQATIAHELTHLSMQLVYNNHCQPFFEKNDDDRRQEYENIVEECKRLHQQCLEISEVYKCYALDQWNKELIVRVAQLIVLYKDNPLKLKVYKIKFKKLFEFYEKKVMQDVERELRLFEPKKEIREMNKKFGVLDESLNSEMLSSNFEKLFDLSQSQIIETQLPELVLECLVKGMKKSKTKDIEAINIFIALEQIFGSENLGILMKAAESEIKPNFIIVDSKVDITGQKMADNLLKAISKLTVIFIATQNTCLLKCPFQKTRMDFEWNDLHFKTKAKIMNSKVAFQDSEVCFNEIIWDEKLLQESPLEMLLTPSSIKLKSFNSSLPEKPRVFIERTFTLANDSEIYEIIVEYNNLCEIILKNKTVLIADSAGMGKSTSSAQLARDLKQKSQLSWVIFIDLKQHTKNFLCDSQDQPESIDLGFFSRQLLKLESLFEQKIFKSFYENGKVIFIVDGFDEISPKYKKFVTIILKALKKSKNHLMVTTRPYFTAELEKALETKAFRILPFKEEDQIEFLTKFWGHDSNDIHFKESVENFLYECKVHWSSYDFYSTPIHIFMLAEVFADQDLRYIDDISPNIYSLYEKFIENKFRVWTQKGPLAVDDSLTLQKTFPAASLWQIFYRLALDLVFADEVAELNIPEIPEHIIDELIARVGIVAYSFEATVQFLHKTYAEYFIANFIINQVFNSKPHVPVVKLFVKVLVAGSCKQIRKFINDKLENMKDFKTEDLTRKFCEIVMERDVERGNFSLSSLVAESKYSCRKLFLFLLVTLDFDYLVKVQLLQEVLQKKGDDYEYFTAIWDVVELFVDQRNIKSVYKQLLFTEVRRKNIISQALSFEKIVHFDQDRVSQLAIAYSAAFLDENEFIQFYYDEHSKNFPLKEILFLNEDSFEKIWGIAKLKLGKENLKKLILGRDEFGDTLLFSFHRDNRRLLEWLETIKDLLEPEELNTYLTTEGKYGRMLIREMLSYSCLKIEEVKRFWDFVEKNASADTQRKLLLGENEEDKKIFLEASICSEDKSVTDFIFEITESMLSNEGKSIIDLLRKRGFLAEFILNMIVCSNEYFDKYSSKLNPGEFHNILLEKGPSEYNVLHCLINAENPNLLWNRVIGEIDDLSEVQRLLFEVTSCNQCNVFFHAAWNNIHFLVDMLEWSINTFDHEFMKQIFSLRINNWSLLHKLAESSDLSLNQKCLEFVCRNFSQDEQREMLLLEGKKGVYPIQAALENENPEVVEKMGAVYLNLFQANRGVLETIIRKISDQEPRLRNRESETLRLLKLQSELEIQWDINTV